MLENLDNFLPTTQHSSWCMDNGAWAHLFKRMKFLSVSQVCLFLMWKRTLTHFSFSNFWSPSQVLQHHQKWFMIDLDHLANFSHFANFRESFFFMLLLICQTSNWWMTSGRTFSRSARICKWLFVVTLRILKPYVFSIFSSNSTKPIFSITKEFATLPTLVSVKSIILFDCWFMKLYISYLALKPGESHRPSPITFRAVWVFSSDTILFLFFIQKWFITGKRYFF